MNKKLFILLQYLVPQHLLTQLFGYAAECRWPWLKNFMIRTFIRRYQVDLSHAEIAEISAYSSFNAFFTRALKSQARPIAAAKNIIVSPVDGCVSQLGDLNKDSLLQAKGAYFTTAALLGSNQPSFNDGHFATFYLAPKDYHRVHIPYAGRLIKTTYIPGKLFSVNPTAAMHIPQLFARNERLVCFFDTAIGNMAVVFIGAMIVGKIQTVWGTEKSSQPISRDYTDHPDIHFTKGAELGCFNLGSSVIILFEKNTIQWLPTLSPEFFVKMGEGIGSCPESSAVIA